MQSLITVLIKVRKCSIQKYNMSNCDAKLVIIGTSLLVKPKCQDYTSHHILLTGIALFFKFPFDTFDDCVFLSVLRRMPGASA